LNRSPECIDFVCSNSYYLLATPLEVIDKEGHQSSAQKCKGYNIKYKLEALAFVETSSSEQLAKISGLSENVKM